MPNPLDWYDGPAEIPAERLEALAELRRQRDGERILDNVAEVRRRVILQALFDVAPCKDSTESGRACRHCEAAAVADAIDRMEVPG